MRVGAPELGILLVIVVLLFGVGRISQIGKELGSGIRAFREGLTGPDKPKEEEQPAEVVPNQEPK